MSCVHYKFKSSLEYQTVTFDGLNISVGDLKKEIAAQKRLKLGDFELEIRNAQNGEVYTNNGTLIPRNTSVIVYRVPVKPCAASSAQKSWEAYKQERAKAVAKQQAEKVSLDQLKQTPDLASANASEIDKVMAALHQSNKGFEPSNYAGRHHGGSLSESYLCRRCNQPGHHVSVCPVKGEGGYEPRFKRTTGIPASFLTYVEDPLAPGALLTQRGQFAVPTIDAQAYKEGKKERPPFLPQPTSAEPEKPRIPRELQCQLCQDLMTDAVVIPCCGNSYCDECIRDALLETDDHQCPTCRTVEVSPNGIIPNNSLRSAVQAFTNDSGYSKVRRRSSEGSAPPPQSAAPPRHQQPPYQHQPSPQHHLPPQASSSGHQIQSHERMPSGQPPTPPVIQTSAPPPMSQPPSHHDPPVRAPPPHAPPVYVSSTLTSSGSAGYSPRTSHSPRSASSGYDRYDDDSLEKQGIPVLGNASGQPLRGRGRGMRGVGRAYSRGRPGHYEAADGSRYPAVTENAVSTAPPVVPSVAAPVMSFPPPGFPAMAIPPPGYMYPPAVPGYPVVPPYPVFPGAPVVSQPQPPKSRDVLEDFARLIAKGHQNDKPSPLYASDIKKQKPFQVKNPEPAAGQSQGRQDGKSRQGHLSVTSTDHHETDQGHRGVASTGPQSEAGQGHQVGGLGQGRQASNTGADQGHQAEGDPSHQDAERDLLGRGHHGPAHEVDRSLLSGDVERDQGPVPAPEAHHYAGVAVFQGQGLDHGHHLDVAPTPFHLIASNLHCVLSHSPLLAARHLRSRDALCLPASDGMAGHHHLQVTCGVVGEDGVEVAVAEENGCRPSTGSSVVIKEGEMPTSSRCPQKIITGMEPNMRSTTAATLPNMAPTHPHLHLRPYRCRSGQVATRSQMAEVDRRDYQRDSSRDGQRDSTRDYPRDSGRDYNREPGRDLGRDQGRDYNRQTGRDYHRDSGRDYPREHSREPGRDYRDYNRDNNKDHPRDHWQGNSRDRGRDYQRDDVERESPRDRGRDKEMSDRDRGNEERRKKTTEKHGKEKEKEKKVKKKEDKENSETEKKKTDVKKKSTTKRPASADEKTVPVKKVKKTTASDKTDTSASDKTPTAKKKIIKKKKKVVAPGEQTDAQQSVSKNLIQIPISEGTESDKTPPAKAEPETAIKSKPTTVKKVIKKVKKIKPSDSSSSETEKKKLVAKKPSPASESPAQKMTKERSRTEADSAPESKTKSPAVQGKKEESVSPVKSTVKRDITPVKSEGMIEVSIEVGGSGVKEDQPDSDDSISASGDELLLEPPEVSKWERDDYDWESSDGQAARKRPRQPEKKSSTLPRSVLNRAETYMSQKPVRPTVATVTTGPATKPTRRVYVEGESPTRSEEKEERKVKTTRSSSLEMQITVKSDKRSPDREERSSKTEHKGHRDDSRKAVLKDKSRAEGEHDHSSRRHGSSSDTRRIEDRSRKDSTSPRHDRDRETHRHEQRDKVSERHHSKEKEGQTTKASSSSEKDSNKASAPPVDLRQKLEQARSRDVSKTQRQFDRKESVIDESKFEPDYEELEEGSSDDSGSEEHPTAEEHSTVSTEDASDAESSPNKRPRADSEEGKTEKKKHKKAKHKKKHKHKHKDDKEKKHKKKKKKHKESKEERDK
ncbi:hypothetical protein BaRGS_00006433 [Batillaria attramentaria]|uniref:E3 ubiquitin-protein ligase RBBP6 n=1 Tax=Batillaria attramentaria TaxID=370345 RepID=A0ABD0LSG0_9CAEN